MRGPHRSVAMLIAAALLAPGCSDWNLRRQQERCERNPELCDTDSDAELPTCPQTDRPSGDVATADCQLPFTGWEARALYTMNATSITLVHVSRDTDGDGQVTGNDAPSLWGYHDVDGVSTFAEWDGRDGSWLRNIAAEVNPSEIGVVSSEYGPEFHSDHDRRSFSPDASERSFQPASERFIHCSGRDDRPSIVDLEGDGVAEFIVASEVYEADWTRRGAYQGSLGDFEGQGTKCSAWTADLDADGRKEIITGKAVYRPNLTPSCLGSHSDGQAVAVDLDGDGLAEVVGGTATEGAWVMDRECNVTARPDWSSYGDLWTRDPVLVAPMLRPGRPTMLMGFGTLEDGRRLSGVIADHELNPVWLLTREEDGDSRGAADFDGDGVHELLLVRGEETRVMDVRTKEERLVLPGVNPRPVDVDGDGFLEVLTTTDAGVVAWNAANGEWARAGRNLNSGAFQPALVAPDGTPSTAPRDWRRMNLVNAQANDGFRYAYGSDPFAEVTDVCTAMCREDRLHVWARVGNAGSEDVENPMLLRLWGEQNGVERLLEEVQVDSVPSGATSEAYHLVVEDAAGITRLWADVVPEGWTLHQCDESNDIGEWDGELCEG